ncbi:cyclic nucleotide-binding domain-containing protein [Defluviimonas aestuarii]|uniref:cyclic nucleotide-binding domain-containing protein n=1 Tax=Albidovulum aestuarii TaxID=1130726 RepID=UPI00249ADDF1|nr:cyclic nucleotide-binding domain-containing protein [Defluviimonas aestuarii]MDI3338213.1 cyclic nucleotide-binding domain-containing protein [Defluviimonas aestuarii]
MELTLESAFSTGGLVGHLSYLLLVLSMMMRVMWILRVLVIASALVAIAYDLIWLKDPVGVFWESLLVLVNIVQLSVTYAQNRLERFNAVEASFVHKVFPGLSNTLKRRILRHGFWVEADEGAELTRAGEPAKHLVYIADGEVEIFVNGNVVGRCANGDFIGELTVLSGDPATGTAIIKRRTLYWAIAGDELRKLVTSNEEINQSIQACFHTNMLSKLIAANHQLQKAGGLVN